MNIDGYIKQLTKSVLDNYFNPPRDRSVVKTGEYHVRRKQIYYDTDGIQEIQVESVKNCGKCPGVLQHGLHIR